MGWVLKLQFDDQFDILLVFAHLNPRCFIWKCGHHGHPFLHQLQGGYLCVVRVSYGLVCDTVGVGTVLIWDFFVCLCVAWTRGGVSSPIFSNLELCIPSWGWLGGWGAVLRQPEQPPLPLR